MKIDGKILSRLCGIECVWVTSDAETGERTDLSARAIFITRENIARMRKANEISAYRQPSPNVRYGDILALVRTNPAEGRIEGRVVPAGQEAPLHITLPGEDGSDHLVPFTGTSMLDARRRLNAMTKRDKYLDRLREGIDGVFQVIAAEQDLSRFSEEMSGQAFISFLLSGSSLPLISVSSADFAMKVRENEVLARLSGLPGSKPLEVAPLHSCLPLIGFGSGQDGLSPEDGAYVRELISDSRDFVDNFILSVSSASIEECEIDGIQESLSTFKTPGPRKYQLTGDWVDALEVLANNALSSLISGADLKLTYFACEGRDIVLLSDREPTGEPSIICSWPSSNRRMVTTMDGQDYLCVSPEEIPDGKRISALRRTLKERQREIACEQNQDAMSHL